MNITIEDAEADSIILAMNEYLEKIYIGNVRRQIMLKLKKQIENHKINNQAYLILGKNFCLMQDKAA